MNLTQKEIDNIAKIVTKRFKLDVTYLTRTQRSGIDKQLKRMGLINKRDEIRKVIGTAIRHATSVLMIKENFSPAARREINDNNALFPKALDKEHLFYTEWEELGEDEKKDEWERVRDRYIDIFEKTFKDKMRRKFTDQEQNE